LGHRFLTEFYRHQCSSRYGICIGAFEDKNLIGQVSAGLPNTKLFNEFKRAYWWRVGPPVALHILRHPGLVRYLWQSWRYTEVVNIDENDADVLFLGVKKEYRKLGVAPELIKCMLGWLGSEGVAYCSMMVEKRNRALRWVIGDLHELQIVTEFKAYGRKMLLYRVPVRDNQAGVRIPDGVEAREQR
jgi:ribosomal protein S18 acetylase RimI-like enzyme